jgi:hypothetical protein
MQTISNMTNMLSKRITGTQPTTDLDAKDSKAQSEAAKVSESPSEAAKDSKALSEATKPSIAAATETAANSDQLDEVVKGTKRLSIEDNEEEKVTTPSKKRNFEDISAVGEIKDGSFVTANDKSNNDSTSKRLKLDETPPKIGMQNESEQVEMKEGEVTEPVPGEV